MHQTPITPGARSLHRYSAKRTSKPVNFVCHAPDAATVSIVGDFNHWRGDLHPMSKRPDGVWFAEVYLHHGHHRYAFLVDGERVLDPEAQGITRDDQNQRVSLLSVS